jgi:hypothetical protein
MQPSPSAIQGWTPELAAELDARLRLRNRPVQADTIKSASRAGGHDLALVYELGGYDPDRSTNDFTKPVGGYEGNGRRGLLPPDAANPMASDYEPIEPVVPARSRV